MIFTQEVELSENLVNNSRALINANSKLTAKLTSAVSLGISYGIMYDSLPAPGKKTTDTALTVGLEVGL